MTEMVLVVVGLASIIAFAAVIVSLNRMHTKKHEDNKAFR